MHRLSLLLFLVITARAGVILTLDHPTINGRAGDILVYTGTLASTEPARLTLIDASFLWDTGLPPFTNTSFVVPSGLNSIAPNGTYTGDIFRIQIHTGAPDFPLHQGTYSLTYFEVANSSFHTDSVRFGISNLPNTSTVPEPASVLLVLSALAVLGTIIRKR